MSYVVGVDAYKGGWVALSVADGAVRDCKLYAHISEVVGDHPAAAVFGVDIPIGLPESATAAWRRRGHLVLRDR